MKDILSMDRRDIGKDPKSDGTIRILDFFRGRQLLRFAHAPDGNGEDRGNTPSAHRLIPFPRLIAEELR